MARLCTESIVKENEILQLRKEKGKFKITLTKEHLKGLLLKVPKSHFGQNELNGVPYLSGIYLCAV